VEFGNNGRASAVLQQQLSTGPAEFFNVEQRTMEYSRKTNVLDVSHSSCSSGMVLLSSYRADALQRSNFFDGIYLFHCGRTARRVVRIYFGRAALCQCTGHDCWDDSISDQRSSIHGKIISMQGGDQGNIKM